MLYLILRHSSALFLGELALDWQVCHSRSILIHVPEANATEVALFEGVTVMPILARRWRLRLGWCCHDRPARPRHDSEAGASRSA